ncbi:MAG TPA: aldose epimerase [Opitutaceae bacterium]|nr:aldose epimerase [Opitutaceae bacterium]
MEKAPYLGEELVRWQIGSSTFLAMPERGARLMHWHITLGDGSVRDVIHWPEVKSLDTFSKVRGGNPILFPFSGRSFDDGEIHFWRTPDGVRRPMPMHGIARQGEFKITRLDARGFAAQLMPDTAARESYPFDYEFIVTYRFEPLGLACEFTLRNLDKQPIPWSAGHHFYFAVPWLEGLKRSDYGIRIPAGKTLKQNPDDGSLQPGPALKLQEPMSNPALLDTIHAGLKSNAVVFGPVGAPGEVTVRLGTAKVPSPDATFVTWTEADDSPFYCVEPWMGPPNAAGNKIGLSWVQPGQSQSFIVDIQAK